MYLKQYLEATQKSSEWNDVELKEVRHVLLSAMSEV